MTARDELHDVPGLVRSGFGSLGGACYLLVRIVDRGMARSWLGGLPVTSAAAVEAGAVAEACQIAFTASGLRALGLSEAALAEFAPEFLDGLSADPRRSHRLGDVGPNAPEHWKWGVGAREPDAMIMLFAPAAEIRAKAEALAEAAQGHGLKVIETLLSITERTGDEPGREPFGFADGLSQPALDWDGRVEAKGPRNRDYRNAIASGEFLLGHCNEYAFVPEHPAVLGRNGTYLVLRDIAQDVAGFWREMRQRAGPDGAIPLAERLCGRGIDGAPLAGLELEPSGDFGFGGDGDGRHCPIGSHVRRANPRTGDDPQGDRGWLRNLVATLGFAGTPRADAVASARFHRILRRGRAYGRLRPAAETLAALDREGEPGRETEAGLYFVCLNASLARQFEFVQGAWLNSPVFAGLAGEQDPLLGHREPFPAGCPTSAFSHIDSLGEPRLLSDLPRFAAVRGGAYFFLPGLAGLRAILSADGAPRR